MIAQNHLNLFRSVWDICSYLFCFGCFAVGLGFEKFFPKSEENPGVNKSDESEWGVNHNVKQYLCVLAQCVISSVLLFRWKCQRGRISWKGGTGHKWRRGWKTKRWKKGRITLVDAFSGVNLCLVLIDNRLLFRLMIHLINMCKANTNNVELFS